MKYIFFTAAVLGILPMTVLVICYRRMIRWSVLGLLLPLLAFNETAINFFSHETYRGTARGMEISLVYIMAVILLLAFSILRGTRRICPDWGSRIYILYFIWSACSLFNAADALIYFFELWKMVMIHLVFMAAYYYLEFNDGDIDIIIYGLVILVAVNFESVFRQYLLGMYRVKGVFPHPNSMAMFMEIAAIIFFARLFNNQEKYLTLMFFVVFVLAAGSIVRTYSRGAIFCFPIGLALTVICSLLGGVNTAKARWLLIFSPIVIAGLLLFMPKVVDRFKNAPKSSGETRKSLALAAVNMMRDKPWVGVGLNNWGIKINPPYPYGEHRFRDAWYDESQYRDGIVETIYLLVGAECGIPCLLLLICWFGYYWISSIRLMRVLRRTKYFYIPAGTFGALTAIFMQSTLEWVLKQQINFIFLVIIFAIISFLNKHHKELLEIDQKKQEEAAAAEAAKPAPPPPRIGLPPLQPAAEGK